MHTHFTRAYFLAFVLICSFSTTFAQRYKEITAGARAINAAVFSRDGRLLATAGSDREIRLYKTENLEKIATLTGHTASVNDLAFSPDGKLLISGSSDQTLRLWDVESAKQIKLLTGHKGVVESLQFGQDNVTVVSAGTDHIPRLWDLHADWQQTFNGHSDVVYTIALSTDGKRIVTGGADKKAIVWDVASGGQIAVLKGHSNSIRSAVFSPDGRFIATGSLDHTAKIWDAATGSALFTLKGHTDILRSVTYSPDGKILATAGRDKTLRLWDAKNGELVKTLEGHTGALWRCAFSPDGQTIATASEDKTVRLWDVSFLHLTGAEFSPVLAERDLYAPPVDIQANIPKSKTLHPQRFVLVLGNENYDQWQKSLTVETNVEFARADALLFQQYAEQTLGVPAKNVLRLLDGTAAQMNLEIEKLALMAKNYGAKAELFVFYAGHGVPQEGTNESYLLPIDVDATQLHLAVKLSDVLARLNQQPLERLTVFLDACFSGKARNVSPLASRGVVVKPKPVQTTNNTVVFSASRGEQAALPYRQAKQGLFTYFLLKTLHETRGDLSYADLFEKLEAEVNLHALLIHNKAQNPDVMASPEAAERWKGWKF